MRPIGLAFVGASLLLAVSCGPGKFSQQATKAQQVAGVFRYPIPTTPTTMDPHTVQDGDTIDALQQVYEGLVGWSTESRPTGYLAEKWEASPDGKTYTFHLKKATFHNGRAVTADDVKWSFERSANPKLASPISDAYLSDIVGFSEKFAGKAQDVAGVKVVDPQTVSITIKAPNRAFLGKLTYLCAAVLPKECFDMDKPVSDPAKMIGCGPFKVKSYLKDQLLVLEANADYHDGAPKLKTIERPILGDAVTRLNKFKQGEIDLVQLERQDLDAINKDSALRQQLHFYPRPSIFYVGMNQLMYAPFKDKRVRQAFAMAINKERICNELLGGANTMANSIVPPGVPGGDRKDAKSFKYDPDAARALLAQAGHAKGAGLPALTLTFRENRPDIKIVAEAVAQDIKNNLGVDVKLQSMEWLAYLTKFNAKQQTFYHMRWAADYADAENFLSHMLATWGPENKLGYDNPVFDQLCKQADSIADIDQSLPVYAQAEDVVLQDAVWVPIYFQRDAELISERVKGLRECIFGHLPHTTTTVE
ncbi:MAG: ABC transporter substrate-binding protein [Armatimonadetes bacterium]|nr:ABC transporter substrate-binding protein [Armatimonadota bacterium]